MGNSEVGHQNIGAGRIVDQELMRITRSIRSGDFFENAALLDAFAHATETGGRVHLLGLVSDGLVHSDLGHLVALLDAAKRRGFPGDRVLIHAITQKGKGYKPAETSADRYHGVSKFDVATGAQKKAPSNAPAYTKVFANALVAEAERDDRIVGITAAMPDGTGMDIFGKRFPNRMFDVGIAEQHAVTFAAGLAASGMKPFCAIYSTFLQRAYDQVVHDVALQGLPVRFAIDRAGLVGADGATHAGAFDVGYLASLPGFTVMAAADEAELARMVATAVAHDSGPIAFRYPRGEGVGVEIPERPEPLEIGRGRVMREGTSVAILSFGARLAEAMKAAEDLEAKGVSATVADARFAKPLDRELILRLAREHAALITVEEGASGGFGSQVLHMLACEGALDRGLAVRPMTPLGPFDEAFLSEASEELRSLLVLDYAKALRDRVGSHIKRNEAAD